MSLLGKIGTNTTIDPKTDKRLLKKWSKSPLWPSVAEQETSVTSRDGEPKHYWHFCPEASFDNFGYFAESLNSYADELDIEMAHSRLAKSGAPRNDEKWTWSSLNAMHYLECPLYSQLVQIQTKKNEDIIDVKPNLYGIGINLNTLFRWLKKR